MPSYDIVSELNEVELRHAVENAVREVGTRFDFRGVVATIELQELTVTIKSESDFQVKQLEDLFRNHCTKRGIDASGVEMEKEPTHSGKFFLRDMTFKQGIDQPVAKDIVRQLKDSKIKVQASIQGDKLRVTGKNRDDLQASIAFLKKADVGLPLQFNNFRD